MRRRISPRLGAFLRREPWLLACLVCGVFLYQPFLSTGLPNTADGILHVFRSALWRWAWNDGILWPRWSTLLYQGYGYPVLHFNPPLLYGATALLSYLTASVLTAFKAVLLLACLSYALSMYTWARDVLGSEGGMVAAVAYTFAIFRFRELYFQGNYQQFLSWSIYPWALFFFHRLAKEPARRYFVGATLSYVAILLTHTISAMLFTPLLAAYGLWLAAHYRQQAWRHLLAAGVLAGGLAAIFLLPALAEQRYTQVHVLTQGFFDVATHFLHWQELVAPTPLLDLSAANPVMPYNFGVLHLLLAALGALAILRRGEESGRRQHLLLAASGLLIAAGMMLPASLIVWRTVPLIGFAEFPSRMFGVAFVLSSLLAGAALLWLARWPGLRNLAVVVAAAGLIVAVAPYQFPRAFMPLQVTPAQWVADESALHIMGTTSGDEFLGIWTTRPPQTPAISRDLARQALVEPPSGVSATVTQSTAHSLRLSVQAAATTGVTVAQFYFPGWRAWIDGVRADISPAEDSGLIRLTVPEGKHEVRLAYGDTPVRTAAMLISGVTVLALLLIAWRIRSPKPVSAGETATARLPLSLAVVLLVLLALKAGWIEPHTSWFRLQSPPRIALPAGRQMQAGLGGKVALLGYDLGSPTVQQGQEMMIRLYWQALTPLDRDYSSFVHLVAGPQQTAFAGSDALHPGYIPTTSWRASLYNVDEYWVTIPADAPPVALTISVGLYNRETGERLGTVALPDLVHVLAAHQVKIPVRADTRFGEQIRLLGYRVSTVGDQIELALYWQANATPQQDYQVFVHLVDAAGSRIAQDDGPPVGGLYPSSRWLAGQVIEDRHRLVVPAGGQPAAVYVGLYDLASSTRLPARKADGSVWADGVVVIPIGK